MTLQYRNSSWPKRPLIEVASLQRGYDLPVQQRVEGQFPVFAANGQLGTHNEAMAKGPGVITGRSGTIGKVHYVESDYWPLNTALFVTDFHGNDPRWVFHMLQSFGLERFAQGAGVPTLNRNLVHGELISVPPLEEQKRIAAILDKADSLRRKRQQAIRLVDDFLRAVFLDMFGGNNAPSVTLAEVCDFITDGTHQTPTYADSGVIFLSAKNVTTGEIDWKNIKHIPQELHRELQKRVSPKLNDILLAKNGTTGVAALVDRNEIFDIYVSLALLRPGPKINPRYLLAAINSPETKKQFNGALKGIGVPNLHLKEIRDTRIPVPSLDDQNKFVRRVEKIEKFRASNRDALVENAVLYAALQNNYFK